MNELLDKAWHDAILKEVLIDRSNPGNRDTVRLVIEWPEGAPPEDGACSIIEFEDCYRLDMNMNFGIIAQESILDVRLDPVNPAI